MIEYRKFECSVHFISFKKIQMINATINTFVYSKLLSDSKKIFVFKLLIDENGND